ncbi:DUF2612 domain-containing protein [Pragia fontium]|uniref:DUF2612 domain-containing protein n=1 Tax=Pragia fontium DSM 5563 = ATCC 49100 TaxID=1122977 RepID=A0AAJ5BH88_9GAMM|nr:DUF2612 domain-containing protein [Pragia fontium]SFC86395.1 Protein of unknown function [Pragia fontium DSM 5563 = ATCC 49100]VEJ56105.1 Protein of uncharacterised function (DUF2612) [Pragia fontium]
MKYSELLIWQYKDKPKAKATIELVSEQYQKTAQGLISLVEALNIDRAEGKNLDLIGKHVGQSRILNHAMSKELFGFWASLNSKGFSQKRQSGGRWYKKGSILAESAILDDEDYRFLIRCRIAKNYMTGTIENITELLSFIFNSESIAYDQYDMSLSVVIKSDDISTFKRYAITQLDILPRPAGVNIYFYTAISNKPFGLLGGVGAYAFNEGQFARIL